MHHGEERSDDTLAAGAGSHREPKIQSNPVRKRLWKERFMVEHKSSWALEVSSAILSVLCLVGMVVLLAHVQDQPLSSWTSTVSPNAFLSVLSTGSKASLILPVTECISQLKWFHALRSKKPDR